MPDLTSALFLGWAHPSAQLRSWAALTTGRPAAMDEPPAATRLAARFARRQRAGAGVVHRSAFHALWDVVDLVAGRGSVVLLDQAAYPLSRWAAAGAALRGARLGFYRHHDPRSLERALGGARRPLVLADGFCPDCGRPAPLPALARMTRRRGGLLLVDDSLACGLLGTGPTGAQPFGAGGAGTASWFGLVPAGVVQVSSLAKAYGAPLAVTTGPVPIVSQLRGHGTRWHASGPSAADLGAALAATDDEGANDRRRRRLCALVRQLRAGLLSMGFQVAGRLFPMVSTPVPDIRVARSLLARCERAGVHALLRQPRCRAGTVLTFIVCSTHGPADIARTLAVLMGDDRRVRHPGAA